MLAPRSNGEFMMTRAAIFALVLFALLPSLAFAHCDTLSGPVVGDAKQAIALGDIEPVLKWLKPGDETEIRRVFAQTLAVRTLSPAAQELADRAFFETVVRLHRASEGAPYTGLRSEDPEPIIQLTDESLRSGTPDALIQDLTADLRAELIKRFQEAKVARSTSASSVESGRRYVAAYVELTHFVERVHTSMLTPKSHDH